MQAAISAVIACKQAALKIWRNGSVESWQAKASAAAGETRRQLCGKQPSGGKLRRRRKRGGGCNIGAGGSGESSKALAWHKRRKRRSRDAAKRKINKGIERVVKSKSKMAKNGKRL